MHKISANFAFGEFDSRRNILKSQTANQKMVFRIPSLDWTFEISLYGAGFGSQSEAAILPSSDWLNSNNFAMTDATSTEQYENFLHLIQAHVKGSLAGNYRILWKAKNATGLFGVQHCSNGAGGEGARSVHLRREHALQSFLQDDSLTVCASNQLQRQSLTARNGFLHLSLLVLFIRKNIFCVTNFSFWKPAPIRYAKVVWKNRFLGALRKA